MKARSKKSKPTKRLRTIEINTNGAEVSFNTALDGRIDVEVKTSHIMLHKQEECISNRKSSSSHSLIDAAVDNGRVRLFCHRCKSKAVLTGNDLYRAVNSALMCGAEESFSVKFIKQ